MPIAADTQQNILYTIYFLLLHNGFAILCAIGIMISILWAIIRPSRSAVFSLIGWALLLLGFEYSKHIVEPLIEQTKTSLITARESHRLAWLVERILGKVVPVGLYASGVLSLMISGILLYYRVTKKTLPIPSWVPFLSKRPKNEVR